MKIGHYMHGLWEKGGIASYISRVSTAQAARGNDVLFFDSHPNTRADIDPRVHFVSDDAVLFDAALTSAVDILHLHKSVKAGSRITVPTIRTLHGHQPYCPSGSRFLKRNGAPCDRGYSFGGCIWGHFVNRCGSVRPARLITDFRSTHDEMSVLRNIPTLTVSRFLKDQMIRAGYSESNISVLYLPAPVKKESATGPETAAREGDPRFVFAGRLTPTKGVAWLLRAAREVNIPFHIDIAGDGYLESDLKALSRRLGVEDRVTFHGWLDDEKVNTLLAGARAVVFPSVWHEPFGLIAVEAMAKRKPVIAANVGALPEIVVNGVTGLLVEPGDVAGLAKAITRLAADWHESRNLGEQGYASVQARFDLDGHMDRLMGHYEHCRQQFYEGAQNAIESDLSPMAKV